MYRLYDRDPEAFGELYDNYAPRIYRYIYFKVATRFEAEDLTAEVFLKTWEYVHKREKRITSFQAFVYRLARNIVVDHYRSRVQQNEHNIEDDKLTNIPVPSENSSEEILIRETDMAAVQTALQKLKEEYREAIVLRYIEGYSIGEIAKILEKSKGAVRVTTHRAVEALKNELETIESTIQKK